jgi:hypothetical protein
LSAGCGAAFLRGECIANPRDPRSGIVPREGPALTSAGPFQRATSMRGAKAMHRLGPAACLALCQCDHRLQRGHESHLGNTSSSDFQAPVALSPPIADQDMIRSEAFSVSKQVTEWGPSMRTSVANAASPRRLRWQAAFTTKTYETLSPVVWLHAFVSDTHMTNWSGGSGLLLSWATGEGLTVKRDCHAVNLAHSF